MSSRPTIRARELVKDLRSGMSDAQLLTKYMLSCAGLARVLSQLVEHKVLSRIELDNWRGAGNESPEIDFRETERAKPGYDIPVYDLTVPHAQGMLVDVSTKGIQIAGLNAVVGETRDFRVGAEFGEFPSFTCQAQCQWTERKSGSSSPLRAGYQITNISYDAFRHLLRLIETCSQPSVARVSWDRGDRDRRSTVVGPDFDKI